MHIGFNKKIISKTFFIFLAIIFLAAIFRTTNLSLIEFKTDEAINLFLSSRLSFGQPLPPGGTVSSLGILNPPFFNYLLIPITFLTHDPKWISFFIGLINSIAIGFLFLAIKRYYGFTTAFITSLLLSFSPWAIIYSRKIWMQDLLIPFFIPFFYSIHKLILEKKSSYWWVYTAFSLFLIQLHQASLFFILLISVFLLFQKVKIDLKYIIIGFIIGIIPLIPYLSYQISNGCSDCKAFVSVKNRLSVERSTQIFTRPFQIIGQGNFNSLLGNDMITFKNQYPFTYKVRTFLYVEYLLLPFSLIIFIKKFRSLRLFPLSVIILPFAYYFFRFEPFIHYHIIIIPILYLSLAVGFNYLINKNFLLKLTSTTLLTAIVIICILFNAAFFGLLKTKGSLGGDYRESFIITQKPIKERLSKYKNTHAYNEMFIASYIPIESMYGYLPIGRILYGKSDNSQERIKILEENLKETPENPMIKNELFASYTRIPPTPDTIDILRKKRREDPIYELFYKEVNQHYLSKNFKKFYESTRFGYMFYYPEHWKVEENKNEIIIKGDEYETYITPLPNKTNAYSQIEIGKNNYLTIIIKPNDNRSKRIIGAIDEIIASIKKL